MEKAIQKRLGKERFKNLKINPTPIGAALGQVYEVEIEGSLYALKVQYPGSAKSINADLKAVKSVIKIVKIIPTDFNTDDIYDEIKSMLHREAITQRS